ncbi:YolD-like family protein [Paucisalibacillus sp. EB02]|uniref:YolD-like family protein n=1 Tax=Paucisalibacillus sp. EB02 TaxID=1347087 RepID=UPI0004B14AC9|nr:YolD-like family protein [Paucisalibacillus sp. EB02]
MVHDRGSIKWTSLMLPEHVELLKKIWNEDKKVVKPHLDEQELEVLNNRILEAYHQKQFIQIEYYQDNQMLEIRGIIKKLDSLHQKILIKNSTGEIISIPFRNIFQVI